MINQNTEANLLTVKNDLNAKINSIKQSYEDFKVNSLNEIRAIKDKYENENNSLKFEIIELKEQISIKNDKVDSLKNDSQVFQNMRIE